MNKKDLQRVFGESQGLVVYHLMQKPRTLEALAKATGKNRETVRTAVRRLQTKGLVRPRELVLARQRHQITNITRSRPRPQQNLTQPFEAAKRDHQVRAPPRKNMYILRSTQTIKDILDRTKEMEKEFEKARNRRLEEERQVHKYLANFAEKTKQ